MLSHTCIIEEISAIVYKIIILYYHQQVVSKSEVIDQKYAAGFPKSP